MDAIHIKGFETYLLLERAYSSHTISAYLRDIDKLRSHAAGRDSRLKDLTTRDIEIFLQNLAELHVATSTRARILSGIKSFYKYLLLEDVIDHSPAALLDAPRQVKKLPEVLSIEEIDAMILQIDHSTNHGIRNRAIIETLYACGLRVSELISLRLSFIFLDMGFIKVVGKNDKERLIPIGHTALKHIKYYIDYVRSKQKVEKDYEDFVFLSRRARPLSRVMIFKFIKKLAKNADISKSVSPHTFRHSFATHLVEGGADLRAIQEMLGHESILTTEIYTHLDRGYLKMVIDKFHPLNHLKD